MSFRSAYHERDFAYLNRGDRTPKRNTSACTITTPGGYSTLALDGGVPPGPRDPNPCLEVKKVPMFRDLAQKMDPCLGIF